MAALRAVISLAKPVPEAQRPSRRVVFVAMAAGMAWMTSEVEYAWIMVYNLADVNALSVPTRFLAVLNEVSKSAWNIAASSVVMAP